MKTPATALALALVLAAAGTSPAGAIRYAVTDLGWLPGTDNTPMFEWWGFPRATPQVDNSGTIGAGQGTLQDGPYQVQTAGIMFHYSGPGTSFLEVAASGGTLPYSSPEEHSIATGVNASGTGIGFQGLFNPQAFIYRPGGPTTPGQSSGVSLIPGLVPGTIALYALGINSAGDVVGQAAAGSTSGSPFLHQIYDLPGLDDSRQRAFLYNGTATVDLNTLIAPDSGWLLTAATSINDLGQITGYGVLNGQGEEFLLTPTPTPEPGTLITVLTGIGCLIIRRAWKN